VRTFLLIYNSKHSHGYMSRVQDWLGTQKPFDDWISALESSEYAWADEWVVLGAVELFNLNMKMLMFAKGKNKIEKILTISPDVFKGKPKRVYLANWWNVHYSTFSK